MLKDFSSAITWKAVEKLFRNIISFPKLLFYRISEICRTYFQTVPVIRFNINRKESTYWPSVGFFLYTCECISE